MLHHLGQLFPCNPRYRSTLMVVVKVRPRQVDTTVSFGTCSFEAVEWRVGSHAHWFSDRLPLQALAIGNLGTAATQQQAIDCLWPWARSPGGTFRTIFLESASFASHCQIQCCAQDDDR